MYLVSMIDYFLRQQSIEFAEDNVFLHEGIVVLLGQADELVVFIRSKIRAWWSVRHIVPCIRL